MTLEDKRALLRFELEIEDLTVRTSKLEVLREEYHLLRDTATSSAELNAITMQLMDMRSLRSGMVRRLHLWCARVAKEIEEESIPEDFLEGITLPEVGTSDLNPTAFGRLNEEIIDLANRIQKLGAFLRNTSLFESKITDLAERNALSSQLVDMRILYGSMNCRRALWTKRLTKEELAVEEL